MPRLETQLGYATSLGTTYTNLYSVPSGSTVTLHLHVTNRLTTSVLFRCYVADTSWSSGEPTGSTLKTALATDTSIGPNGLLQISGMVLASTNKLVVWANTGSALDVLASGVVLT